MAGIRKNTSASNFMSSLNSEFVDFKDMCCLCGNEIDKKFHKEDHCPNCGGGLISADWKKPPIETVLFLLQKEYLLTRDKKHLDSIFVVSIKYCLGLAKRSLSGKVIYSESLLHEKASDASTALIEKYLTNPDWKVDRSFGGILFRQVQAVLYKYKTRRAAEKELPFGLASDGDSTVFHEGTGNSQQATFVEGLEKSELANNLVNMVNRGYDYVSQNSDSQTALNALLGVTYYICSNAKRKGKITQNMFYSYFGGDKVKDIVQALMADVMNAIRSNG